MSRRSVIVAFVGAAVAAVAVAAVWLLGIGSAQAQDPKPPGPEHAVGHDLTGVPGQDPESVQKYWTPERQKNAKPAEMPEAPAAEPG
ncbi:MAG: hypothetical protein JWN52_1941 [Actinomycetia bacterium]|jgi:hypothetical protein|nr:hypothetical protein [Actinomycetes bacterium]